MLPLVVKFESSLLLLYYAFDSQYTSEFEDEDKVSVSVTDVMVEKLGVRFLSLLIRVPFLAAVQHH